MVKQQGTMMSVIQSLAMQVSSCRVARMALRSPWFCVLATSMVVAHPPIGYQLYRQLRQGPTSGPMPYPEFLHTRGGFCKIRSRVAVDVNVTEDSGESDGRWSLLFAAQSACFKRNGPRRNMVGRSHRSRFCCGTMQMISGRLTKRT